MTGFIIAAIIFSIPTIYYRIKLKKCEEDRKRMIENAWKGQWEDWGE